MSLIKGKQLANATIEPSKLDYTANAWNFSSAAHLRAKDPVHSMDVATKGWVEENLDGLDAKESCVVASTANFASTFSSNTLTASAVGALSFDGVAVALNERVLIKDQTAGLENGIYFVSNAGNGSTAGILTRATDMDPFTPISSNVYTFIEEGTANADKGFVLTTNGPITLNTSALSFTQFNSSAISYTAGDGLALSGSAFSVDFTADKGLQFNGSTGALEIELNLTSLGLQADANGLTIKLDSASGSGLAVTSAGLAIVPANDSLVVVGGTIKSAVPQTSDTAMSVSSTKASDDVDSGLTITSTPANNSLVTVLVNGVSVEVGDAVKTKDCFFSVTASTPFTARALADITASDKFIWNGNSTYSLETSDRVDFIYVTA
jgi:hypothetical protein